MLVINNCALKILTIIQLLQNQIHIFIYLKNNGGNYILMNIKNFKGLIQLIN